MNGEMDSSAKEPGKQHESIRSVVLSCLWILVNFFFFFLPWTVMAIENFVFEMCVELMVQTVEHCQDHWFDSQGIHCLE